MENSKDPKVQSRALAVKHQLWKMHRMLCNMSDAKFYTETTSDRRVCQNASGVVEEIFQKAQDLLQRQGITLEYHVPGETVLCMLDEQLLERAIYNMISNAVKFSGSKTGLKAELKRKDNRLSLSITEPCDSVNAEIPANIFRQYTREPGVETGAAGIGLGMSIVCSAARAHKGTVLLDHPSKNETRITLSFPIDLGQDTKVASGVSGFDYAGGWDRGLLELADILPSDFYA
jgi:K+-sensing histidine kinase KdpD